jgi:hypothetical protein
MAKDPRKLTKKERFLTWFYGEPWDRIGYVSRFYSMKARIEGTIFRCQHCQKEFDDMVMLHNLLDHLQQHSL